MNNRHTTTLYVLPGGLSPVASHRSEILQAGVARAISKGSKRRSLSPLTRNNLPELRVLPDCGAEIYFEPVLEQSARETMSNLGPTADPVEHPAVENGRRTKCDTVIRRLTEVDSPYEEDLFLAGSAASTIIEDHEISEVIFDRFAYALCQGKKPAIFELLNQELRRRDSRLRVSYIDQRFLTCSAEHEDYFREVVFCTSVGLVDLDRCVSDNHNPAQVPSEAVTIWPIREVRTIYFSDINDRLVFKQRKYEFVFHQK